MKTTTSTTLLLAAALALVSSVARADGPTADDLFREGRRLMEAGSLEQACVKFTESQRLDPAAGTLLNLAECEEKRGRLATAAATYKEAAVAAALRGRSDWERHALERFEALVPVIPAWTIRVAPGARAAGVVLMLDDRTIPTEEGDTRRLLDPGPHTLVANGPGKRPWRHTAEVVKGTQTIVSVPLLEERVAERPPSTSGAETRSTWARPTGLVVGGVGVAGVVFGAVAGALALSARSEAVSNCPSYPNACLPEGTSANERAQTWATGSTIGLGAGLALVATGAFLAFVVPSF
ncbi:MAG: hypothetical protein U0270_25660 [Labilithrix sp.]